MSVQNTAKKLIEVALPLEAINRESAREKSIRHGHPSTLHLWWARRPLAACRAVIFASMVDDPSSRPDGSRRKRIRSASASGCSGSSRNSSSGRTRTNESASLECGARARSWKAHRLATRRRCYDPFCGGGSIPLEAQRLGLEAYASDLNPVAVLITKALIEIPPKFAGRPPVNPNRASESSVDGATWKGARASPRTCATTASGCATRREAHRPPLPEGDELPDGSRRRR